MAFTLTVNGKAHTLDVEPETPLLWVIRDTIGLTGTKYGCGIAQCGACTVHVDGQPVKSCNVNAASVVGKKITTIEGLDTPAGKAVQAAWQELDAVDAELKEEIVDEGVGEPDTSLEEPDALGDADSDDTDPPCGANTGTRAAISSNF